MNLNTLGLTVGQSYALDIFHAERQTVGSNFQIQTTLNIESQRQYVYNLKALDANDDSLTYSLKAAPAGMKLDPLQGVLTWNPSLSQTGIHRVEVQATDGRGGIATQSFDVNVTVSNPSEIRGTIFNDIDGDGVQEGLNLNPPLEPGLQGWVAYIDENRNGQRDLTEIFSTTDAQGNYSFANLPSGVYAVAVESRNGWKPTVNTQAVILGSGLTATGVNFGNQILLGGSENRAPEMTSTPPALAKTGKLWRYDALATDADGDRLIYDLAVKPAGMAIDEATGAIVWQPTAEQTGIHDVVLRVRDGRSGIDLQSFQVEVTANTSPIFMAPAKAPQTAVGIPLEYQFQVQDAEGDPISYSLKAAPTGAVIDSKTGRLTWTPTAAQIGNNYAIVTASDGRGGETSQRLDILVLASLPNASPVITSVARTRTVLGQPYQYQVTATDPNSDPLTYTLESAPSGMVIDQQGKLSWTPNTDRLGTHQIALKVSDGRGGFSTQNFNLNVLSNANLVNHAPDITSNPFLAATINQQYRYNLTATDTDNDTIAWLLESAPSGMVVDPQTGTILWTPNSSQLGTHDIAISALDPFGEYTTQTFTIDVRALNIAPTITSNPTTTAAIGKTYTYKVTAKDIEGDPLTYSLNNAPTGMTIDATTGLIQWTPGATQLGKQDITLTVTDSNGAQTAQTYSLLVASTATNLAPSITSAPNFNAAIGQTYKYQVIAQDPEGSNLTYLLQDAPTGMTIDATTGLIQWTPGANQTGNYALKVVAVDPQGLAVVQGYTLTARVNQTPIITSTPKAQVTLGNTYHYDAIATDPDGDTLSYQLDESSLARGMKIDSYGRISWKPTTNHLGTQPVTITVSDVNGAKTTQIYNLEVLADNIAPVINLLRETNIANIGDTISFQLQATDNVAIKSRQLVINNQTITLDANGVGSYKVTTPGVLTVTALVTDINGNTSTATTNVTILDPTDTEAPNISFNPISGNITNFTDLIGTVTDNNLDYYVLEAALQGTNNFVEIFRGTNNVNNGVLGKFDPTLLANDTYTIRLSAYDTNGHSSSIESTIDVAGDLKLGNFRLSFTDLSLPVTGIPITAL